MKDNNFKDKIKYTNPDQQDINNKMMALLNEYQKDNSFKNREFLCYLTAAIFLTYKKQFPQLNIYIPFRTKGDTSFMNNIPKEFSKYIFDTDSTEPFDTSSITKDISGIKIVLDNINVHLPAKGKSTELLNDPEIKQLLSNAESNTKLLHEVEEYIQSSIQNGESYFKYKKDILKRIVELTPEEFTKERYPSPSFMELSKTATHNYEYLLENDSFPTSVSESEITDLANLLNDFRCRIHDPLHFAILKKTLPIVFESPLIKNGLKTSFKFDKDPKKDNGFRAIYYTLNTPFGPVEVQAQSNKAYYAATKGSAYHSGIPGKTINVKDFFELVDPNDENDLSYYLNILDSTSADAMISPYEIPEFETEEDKEKFYTTSIGKAFIESESYREMMKHIRIKSKMEILPEHFPLEAYTFTDKKLSPEEHKNSIKNGKIEKKLDDKKLSELIESGKVKPITIETNEYLFSTALALSPYMNVCSSSHTSYTNAGILHKKVIGEFAEVLRKKDSNTCLRDMLIRRLEKLIEHNGHLNDVSSKPISSNMKHCLEIVRKHDEISNKLPKDISKKNILSYSERLRIMEKSNSEKFDLESKKSDSDSQLSL